MTQIRISEIRTDGGTQSRAEINQAVVNDYIEAMMDGAVFPPVKVVFDGATYNLYDGYHRLAAAKALARTTIEAEVEQGALEDAQWESFGANKAHGLQRTNEDKARATKAALLHPRGASLADSVIAAHVGVSAPTVAKYRAELIRDSKISNSQTRTGTDGRTINTSKIGRKTEPELKVPRRLEKMADGTNWYERYVKTKQTANCDVLILECPTLGHMIIGEHAIKLYETVQAKSFYRLYNDDKPDQAILFMPLAGGTWTPYTSQMIYDGLDLALYYDFDAELKAYFQKNYTDRQARFTLPTKAVDSNGTPLELDHVVTSRLFSGEGIVISITGDAPTVSVKAADGTYSTIDWRKLTIIGKQNSLPSPAEPAAQNGSGATDIQRITPQGMMFLEPGLHWRDRYNALKAQYAGDSKILLAATGTNYVVFGSDAPLIKMTMNNIECIHSPLGWAAIFPCDRVGELSGFELIEYTELQFDRDDLKPPAAAVPVEINLGDLVQTKTGTLGKVISFIGDAVEIATRNGVIKRNREFVTKRTYAVNDRVQHRDTGKLATVTARHNGQVYFEFDGEYSPVPCPEGEFDPVRTMERAQPVDEQQHIERVLDEQAAPHVNRDTPITLDAQSVALATRINLHLCEVRDALRDLAAHNPDLASEMTISYLSLRQLALDVMDAGVKLDWSDVFDAEMEVAS